MSTGVAKELFKRRLLTQRAASIAEKPLQFKPPQPIEAGGR
jgi:hypothetical protein